MKRPYYICNEKAYRFYKSKGYERVIKLDLAALFVMTANIPFEFKIF